MTRFGIFGAPLSVAHEQLAGTVLERKIGGSRMMMRPHEFEHTDRLRQMFAEHVEAKSPLVLTLRNPIDDAPHQHRDRPWNPHDMRLLHTVWEEAKQWHETKMMFEHQLLYIQVANELVGAEHGNGGGVGWVSVVDEQEDTLQGLDRLYAVLYAMFRGTVHIISPALMELDLIHLTSGAAPLRQDFARKIVAQAMDWNAYIGIHLNGVNNRPTSTEQALASFRRWCDSQYDWWPTKIATEWSPAGIGVDAQRTPENIETLLKAQWQAMQDDGGVIAAYYPLWAGADLPLRFAEVCLMQPGNRALNLPVVESVGRVVSASGSGGEVDGEVK